MPSLQAEGSSLDSYAALDAAGGLAKGRRELVQYAYDATGKNEWWATTLVVEYDLAPGSGLEILFADKGKGKTGITLNHTRIQERRAADRLRAGWSACFDALKALLEQP